MVNATQAAAIASLHIQVSQSAANHEVGIASCALVLLATQIVRVWTLAGLCCVGAPRATWLRLRHDALAHS